MSDNGPLNLSHASRDALLPMHLRLSACGKILHAGPTISKLRRDFSLPGCQLFDVFNLRRPLGAATLEDLKTCCNTRLQFQFSTPPETVFNGILVADDATEEMLLNLSFGTSLVDAINDYDLHLPDFAPTDPSIEMLYLMEAKAIILDEWRRLNLRLQSAKIAAEEQAFTDTLTGLKNRRALDHVLERLVAAGESFGLIHLDLDFFKAVNDTLGHAAGDHVLQVASNVMVRTTRSQDTLARAGGDEFVIVLPGTVELAHLLSLSERLIAQLEVPIPFGAGFCNISGSAGITVSHGGASNVTTILEEADKALYRSKELGRGRATLYRPGMQTSLDISERPQTEKASRLG